MKTLINKNNPAIRITAPEIVSYREFYTLSDKDSHYLFKMEDWTLVEEPAECSEEDKHRCGDAIYFLETAKTHYADTSELEKCIEWLKSLNSPVEEEPEGWSKADCVKEIPFSLIYEGFAEHWRLGNAVEPGNYYIPISRLRWGIKGNLEEIPSSVDLEKAAEEYVDELPTYGEGEDWPGTGQDLWVYNRPDIINTFKAGAEWMKKQKPVEEEPVEWSEKEQTIIEGACNALEIHGHSKLADRLKSIHPQPKQEWSEEDEHRRNDAIYFLETAKKHYADTSEIELTIEWLKSLQPQPKQEWSEDDKFKLEDAITGIDVGIGFYETEGKHPNLLKAIIEAKEWLKSLRPQSKVEEEPKGWSKADCVKEIPFSLIYEGFAEHWRLGNAVEPGNYYIPISRLRWGIKGNLEENVDLEKLALEKYPETMTYDSRGLYDRKKYDRDIYKQGLKDGYELGKKGGSK